jgi:hypothetical protein
MSLSPASIGRNRALVASPSCQLPSGEYFLADAVLCSRVLGLDRFHHGCHKSAKSRFLARKSITLQVCLLRNDAPRPQIPPSAASYQLSPIHGRTSAWPTSMAAPRERCALSPARGRLQKKTHPFFSSNPRTIFSLIANGGPSVSSPVSAPGLRG